MPAAKNMSIKELIQLKRSNPADQTISIKRMQLTINMNPNIESPITRWCSDEQCNTVLKLEDYQQNMCRLCFTEINYENLLKSKKRIQIKIDVVTSNSYQFKAVTSEDYGIKFLQKISNNEYNSIDDFDKKWFKLTVKEKEIELSKLCEVTININAKLSIFNNGFGFTVIEVEPFTGELEQSFANQNNHNENK